MSRFKITSDLEGLRRAQREMQRERYVQVGVFGAKNTRKEEGAMTNAELGAIHEFGSPSRGIVARSFLRMPLRLKAKQILNQAREGFADLMIAGKTIVFWQRLGAAAEGVVIRAFQTGGFGQWKANAPSTVKRKGSSVVLVERGELRRATASRVVGS